VKMHALNIFHHLSMFQLIFVPLIGALFLRSLIQFGRGRHRFAAFLGMTVWAAAGAAVARPDLTIIAAKTLGIGRGADLILYMFAVAFLLAAFYMYNRMAQLESVLTSIVRQMAIRENLDAKVVEPVKKSKAA
jgi:small membrane protein